MGHRCLKDYGKAVRKILAKAGCELLRQGRGDHEIWISPNASKPFTVPVNYPLAAPGEQDSDEGRWIAEGILGMSHALRLKRAARPLAKPSSAN
ncbi:MAG: type II toxin-antitoxin system HicA family toxin [Geminicoccaceae bacterium]